MVTHGKARDDNVEGHVEDVKRVGDLIMEDEEFFEGLEKKTALVKKKVDDIFFSIIFNKNQKNKVKIKYKQKIKKGKG